MLHTADSGQENKKGDSVGVVPADDRSYYGVLFCEFGNNAKRYEQDPSFRNEAFAFFEGLCTRRYNK